MRKCIYKSCDSLSKCTKTIKPTAERTTENIINAFWNFVLFLSCSRLSNSLFILLSLVFVLMTFDQSCPIFSPLKTLTYTAMDWVSTCPKFNYQLKNFNESSKWINMIPWAVSCLLFLFHFVLVIQSNQMVSNNNNSNNRSPNQPITLYFCMTVCWTVALATSLRKLVEKWNVKLCHTTLNTPPTALQPSGKRWTSLLRQLLGCGLDIY